MDSLAAALGGIACAVVFVEAFLRLRLAKKIRRLLERYASTWRLIRSPRISEHWKEKALPSHACRLLRLAGTIIGQLTAILVALLVLLYAAALGLAGPLGDLTFLADWPFNLTALLAGFLSAALRRRNST